MPAERVQAIAPLCQLRRVGRGLFLFYEGESADALHILVAGRIKMIRETREGQEVILRLIGPGEFFGGAGIWGGATYPATAVAVEDAVAIRLAVADVTPLLRAHPDLGLALVHELAGRLREAETRILELQTQRVERRIAHALLRLANKTGVRSTVGIELGLALSRQDLADLTGTTIGTVSRTLSDWERRGLVATGRERVAIRDAHGLVALAEDLPPRDEGSTAQDANLLPSPR